MGNLVTLYAHAADGTIDHVGALPALWLGPTRWHDWRGDPATWATQPSDWGWLPVVEAPRPADTAETTSDPAPVALVDGVPTQQWTVRPWTAEELTAREQADAERARYETHEAILDATAALMADAHTDGQPWVQPTGAHDAYPRGITVTHEGKTWENLTPANVWQPGVSGWRELVAEGYPAWVQPSGAHDAYKTGDRVSFEGSDYESTIAGNTWSPTAYPQGWRKL